MPTSLEIKKGDKYNQLTIIKEVEKKGKDRYFQCECECGKKKNIRLCHIRSGGTKSCGCLQKKYASKSILNYLKTGQHGRFKHGLCNSKIYNSWRAMLTRCNNNKDISYTNYGGRGITYDKKWGKFEGFYEDMGETYKEGLSIDRINNDGNYCKENCKWSTRLEQMRNQRKTILYNGKSLMQCCKELGLNYNKTYKKFKNGSSLEKLLFNK